MTRLENELRAALRSQAGALHVPERISLERDVGDTRRHLGPRWLLTAACLALVVAGIVALARWRADDPEPAPPIASVVPDPTTAPVMPVDPVEPDTTPPPSTIASVVPDATVPAAGTNGWVALDAGPSGANDMSLVRPGVEVRLPDIGGSDTATEACPAWSPDGTRLMFGRLNGSPGNNPGGAELVIVPVGQDGEAGTPTVITLDGFDVTGGFEPHPCAIWAPDGRWVALAGGGQVWLVDTQIGGIRRLPNLRPSDLEWRPGTDQLAIAGDMGTDRSAPTLSTPVSVYDVSTGDLHQLGTIDAAEFTWSPDGSMLAYRSGEEGPHVLWLVDADGTNQRLLVADTGAVNHGIGPVWSPTGERIAYQRICCGSAEGHEVVLVSVADGTETVIAPPQTDGPGGTARWYPWVVTWSPDGSTLLYTAWSLGGTDSGVLAVPADTPTNATILTDMTNPQAGDYSHRWAPIQRWGRQPG